ncbi:MarR family winged helix-turn-helix transcriptional regulator [Marinibaculum pumilum]|uniref:MarR family winged helix-turn-helix transcriptional regulator n=1 Tax=Marinibaculum pumilum TaxID=1766165 RepID=A0ABV7KYV5_9PROT
MSKDDFSAVDDRPVPFATTLHVRDTCLCLHAQRAARALARHFDDALRPCGLTNGQFSLLMSLNRPEPPGMTDVAGLLAMDRTTLTAALKPLQRRGLVRVEADPRDRRGRRLALTDDGLALLARALPIWQDSHRRIDALLAAGAGPGDPEALRQDLRSLSGS